MPSILRYFTKRIFAIAFVSMLLLMFSPASFAQVRPEVKYGLRLGFDLSRIPMHYLNPYRTDIAIQADVRVDTNFYIATETGWNKTHLENKPVFDYISSGYYLKAGVDYNLMKRKYPWESNIVYVGLRYGIARMTRKIPEYQISDPYWGNVNGQFSSKTLLPQWGELVLGLKVEVLKNLFLSWGLHLRVLVTQNIDKEVRPYLIPGFGKATHNAVFDMNYTISYRIPLWKHPPVLKRKKSSSSKNKQ